MTVRSRGSEFAWVAYLSVVGTGLLIALYAWRRGTGPYFPVAMAVLVGLLVCWTLAPKVALSATLFLLLVSDRVTTPYYPFTKNFSSRESILYVSDSVSISPFEITMVVGLVVVIWRTYDDIGKWSVPAPLLKPLALFTAFCLMGFVVGMSRGGDMRVALFEIRPLLYLPVLYVLFVNVCNERRDYARLLGLACAAIFVQSLLSLEFYFGLPASRRLDLDSLTEHGSAIGANLVVIVVILHALVPRRPKGIMVALMLGLVPIMWVYIVGQRRAAIIALGGGLMLIAVHLWWRQRRTFWAVVPVAGLLIALYVAAFWNVDSTAGFPAQAIKGVIAPEDISAIDQGSDLYRVIEGVDLSATIRDQPITGQGFGKPFLRPIPLPDISFFEFNAYLPHNSVLWVWIKTGFGGFVVLLYLIARSLTLGVDRIRGLPLGRDLVVALSMSTFIVMYSIYLFVDIGWEPRNVTLLAMAFALSTGTFVERMSVHDPTPRNRSKSSVRRPKEDRSGGQAERPTQVAVGS